MEEKKFILVKPYLEVRCFSSLEVYCQEGRTVKLKTVNKEEYEEENTYGEIFLLKRKDFLYSHSDTSITMCHLTFRGESLEGLELKELDFINILSKLEYWEHRLCLLEYKKQNELDKEEIRENHTKLKEEFEEHKIEFEEHKQENIEDFKENAKEHEELRKLVGGYKITTWSELKTLRDTSSLSKGSWYRITDYDCILNPSSTTVSSAHNVYDIIVLATSDHTLTEEALATRREGDTYFQYANLEAWELKYCLDNDQVRFPFCGSDADGGKGVVWWMKDEYNNKCDYDFKNIKMVRYEITATSIGDRINSYSRAFTAQTSRTGWTIDTANIYFFYTFSWCPNSTLNTEDVFDLSVMDLSVNPNIIFGSNVVYSQNQNTDEGLYPNCFILTKLASSSSISLEDYTTFQLSDNKLEGKNSYITLNCGSSNASTMIIKSFNNILRERCSNITLGFANYRNEFFSDAYDISLGSTCTNNKFFQYSQNTTLAQSCDRNVFFHSYDIYLGPTSYANYFGPNCSRIYSYPKDGSTRGTGYNCFNGNNHFIYIKTNVESCFLENGAIGDSSSYITLSSSKTKIRT